MAQHQAEKQDPVFFRDLCLSSATVFGLNQARFSKMTEIQRAAIPAALEGNDVLGAAKTGSGKTLAFLVPGACVCLWPSFIVASLHA